MELLFAVKVSRFEARLPVEEWVHAVARLDSDEEVLRHKIE